VFCGDTAKEADHAIPKSRGGDTTTGPDGNLQPTCTHCNRQKGAKTSDEYLEWKEKREQ
jgi:5-methylcytosine-specific restriction endonuclease McrA